MSKLVVKTKNNTSAQGKPRVYFSCHPDDFSKYFDELCKDIFDTQDCAIYYESDWEHETDEDTLTFDLSNMQLFVIPLTTKFLFHPCRAREYEYDFAIKHHIPILPIAVEDGIDNYFQECMNKVGKGYGDIQFLNKVSFDYTEIPYEEKLKKYLNSILIGDELAERIRAAFDAYIFLSYRKKDRAYAKKLMKIIHRIPYCRDIAIWYDEFLVPGDNWSKTIQEAMAKSKLVTLLVTPSILEEPNFIIEHEYPDAKATNKEIIPAELKPTDRDSLARLFEDISEPVDGTDLEAMQEAFQSIARQENDHIPEHNFLIGLAYLGAIDVERDPKRAVELITSAAEAEPPVIEAIEKLVDMYSTGEGVERNYLTAVEWQEKLITALEQTKEDPLADDEIIIALRDAGEMWEELEKFEQAKKVYLKMIDLSRQIDNKICSLETKIELSRNYTCLGKLYLRIKDTNAAKEYLEKALTLNQSLLSYIVVSPYALFQLSLNLVHLGRTYKEIGDISKSLGAFEIASKNFALLVDKTQLPEARINLSEVYDNIGEIYMESDNISAAQKYFEKALKLRETLIAEIGTVSPKLRPFIRLSLAKSYHNLGVIYVGSNTKVAQEYFEKSLEQRKAEVAETKTLRSRKNLAESYSDLGGIYIKSGNLSEAKKYFEKASMLREALIAEANTPKLREDLAFDYDVLCRICITNRDQEEVQKYFEKASELLLNLAQETKSLDAYTNLAEFYFRIGTQLYGNSKMMCLKKSHAIYCTLAKLFPTYDEFSKTRDDIEKMLEDMKS